LRDRAERAKENEAQEQQTGPTQPHRNPSIESETPKAFQRWVETLQGVPKENEKSF
jgi:hypothetical protein